MRRLYGRDHLDHVLGTFGLILFFNELVRIDLGTGRAAPAAAGLARDLGARSCRASNIRPTASPSSSPRSWSRCFSTSW